MTKRDLELITEAMRLTRRMCPSRLCGQTLDSAAENMADALKQANPALDRAQFLKACGA